MWVQGRGFWFQTFVRLTKRAGIVYMTVVFSQVASRDRVGRVGIQNGLSRYWGTSLISSGHSENTFPFLLNLEETQGKRPPSFSQLFRNTAEIPALCLTWIDPLEPLGGKEQGREQSKRVFTFCGESRKQRIPTRHPPDTQQWSRAVAPTSSRGGLIQT